MEYKKIPDRFQVGGQSFEVRHVDRCDGNAIGMCYGGSGYIEIADLYDRNCKQSEDSRVNTFYHELVHAILQNMGWDELNGDHKFVCSFAGFLTEAMRDAMFKNRNS